MGQRSQIYIRIRTKDKTYLYAKYYQWNYAERMISRARYGIEYIKHYIDEFSNYMFEDNQIREQINRMFDVNFDMKDVAISVDLIKEHEKYGEESNFNEFVIKNVDNNDGKLFVDVNATDNKCKKVKYCLTDYELNILTPKAYMDWDWENWLTDEYLSKEAREKCLNNIEYLETIEQMTEEELKDFVDYDYWLDMNKPLF